MPLWGPVGSAVLAAGWEGVGAREQRLATYIAVKTAALSALPGLAAGSSKQQQATGSSRRRKEAEAGWVPVARRQWSFAYSTGQPGAATSQRATASLKQERARTAGRAGGKGGGRKRAAVGESAGMHRCWEQTAATETLTIDWPRPAAAPEQLPSPLLWHPRTQMMLRPAGRCCRQLLLLQGRHLRE